MKLDSQSNCPVTGEPGRLLRVRRAEDLITLYHSFLGGDFPNAILRKYLHGNVSEFYSPASGMRWYTPMALGDGDYYEALATTFKWYYGADSWDKQRVQKRIAELKPKTVVEVGCGSGRFLERLKELGINGWGVDINADAVAAARSKGLNVVLPSELYDIHDSVDALVLLQTIEHVSDPVKFLGDYVRDLKPTRALLSAPCFESLLGHTSDPLCWPPHHATSWSERGFKHLAAAVGYRVESVCYSPLSWNAFKKQLKMEGSRKLFQLPRMPTPPIDRMLFTLGRWARRPWATRSHSILVEMVRA